MLSKATQDEGPPQDTLTSWDPVATGWGAAKRKGKAPSGAEDVEDVDDAAEEVVVELWVEEVGGVPEAGPHPVARSASPAASRAG
jgi:hypothetical protein